MDGYAIFIQFIGAIILLALGAIQLFYPEVKMYNIIKGQHELTVWAKVYIILSLCAISLFGGGAYLQWNVSKEARNTTNEMTNKLNRCDTLNQQTQQKIKEQTETINVQVRKLDKLEGYLIAKGINPQTLFITNNYNGLKQRHFTNEQAQKFSTRVKDRGTEIVIISMSPDKECITLANEMSDKLKTDGYTKIRRQYNSDNSDNLFDTIEIIAGSWQKISGKIDTVMYVVEVHPATNTN